ncbi:hypothetical protein AAY473_007691 [Plecturocebus cupreus]
MLAKLARTPDLKIPLEERHLEKVEESAMSSRGSVESKKGLRDWSLWGLSDLPASASQVAGTTEASYGHYSFLTSPVRHFMRSPEQRFNSRSPRLVRNGEAPVRPPSSFAGATKTKL